MMRGAFTHILLAVLGGSLARSSGPPVELSAPDAEVTNVTVSAPPEIPIDAVDAPIDPADAEDAGAIAKETARGRWDRDAMARIRARLRARSPSDAARVLQIAGISRRTAFALATVFTAKDGYYEERVDKRALLVLAFVKIGIEDWELTPESLQSWRLPFHPKLVSPLVPPQSLGPARGKYERCDAIGEIRFDSDEIAPALRCVLLFREHRLAFTTSTDLLRDDWSFADRIDSALSIVPAAHLALVREIVLDPGEHPAGVRNAVATTAFGTRINLFLAGAGKDVAQDRLAMTTAHEVGHVVSLEQGDGLWTEWSSAIARDRLFVSAYALTNAHEDFAETYVLYLGGGRTDAASRARFGARFAILDTLFKE